MDGLETVRLYNWIYLVVI